MLVEMRSGQGLILYERTNEGFIWKIKIKIEGPSVRIPKVYKTSFDSIMYIM